MFIQVGGLFFLRISYWDAVSYYVTFIFLLVVNEMWFYVHNINLFFWTYRFRGSVSKKNSYSHRESRKWYNSVHIFQKFIGYAKRPVKKKAFTNLLNLLKFVGLSHHKSTMQKVFFVVNIFMLISYYVFDEIWKICAHG